MKTYRHETQRIDECMIPQRFCRLKCDEHIPETENILNFNCWRDCNEKIKSDSNELKVVDKTFDPKVQEKIDFLPKGSSLFRPGTVADKKKENTSKGQLKEKYYVSYIDDENNNITEGVFLFQEKMFKCSSKLTLRGDCGA